MNLMSKSHDTNDLSIDLHRGLNDCGDFLISTSQLSQSGFGSVISDWGLLEKIYRGPEWLGFFDAANLPLPSDLHNYLAALPVWTRLLIGLGSLEIVPLAVDAFILYTFWKRVTTAPSNFDALDLPTTYDQERVLQYFMKYPILVIKRTMVILEQSRDLLGEFLQDRATGAIELNAAARAQQLSDVLRELGPTTIEIGRSLSARVDLLPKQYIEALSRLELPTITPSVEQANRNEARVSELLDIFILRTLAEFAAQNIPSLRDRLRGLVAVIDACCEKLIGGRSGTHSEYI